MIIEEINEKLINKSTKRQAAKLNDLINNNHLGKHEVNDLIKHGIDKEVIEYWKNNYSK